MNTFTNSISLTICGVIIWIFLVFLMLRKSDTPVSIYFKVCIILLFFLLATELLYTFSATYYNDKVELIFYLCFANIYLMSAITVSLLQLLVENIRKEDSTFKNRMSKVVKFIFFTILYCIPLIGIAVIGDIKCEYDKVLDLYYVAGQSFDFIIIYDVVLCLIIGYFAIKYKKVLKNMNIHPMIVMILFYIGINIWMIVTSKNVNETAIFFSGFFLTVYLTFESQDNALLYEYMDAKKESEESNDNKTKFLVNMSHQIRTPMSVIIGYCDILSFDGAPESDINFGVDTIYKESKKLKDLIENVLDVSKLESDNISIKNEEYTLNEIIHNINSTIFSVISPDTKFSIITNYGVPSSFIGDEKIIYKILSYTIMYCIERNKYGTTNLIIDGKTRGDVFDFAFTIKTSGLGISKEDVELNIKDYVKNIDDKEPLKMVVAKELIKNIGGSIEFNNEADGNSFNIKLSQKICLNKVGNEGGIK